MKVRNLTPHPLMFYKDGNLVLTMESEEPAVRVGEERSYRGHVEIDGHQITVLNKSLGDAKDLPPKQEGVYLIVSKVVADSAPERDDLLYPDMVIRDDYGMIIGCMTLARNVRGNLPPR